MASIYSDIVSFMKEYFPAYSQYGQLPEAYHVMDKFYAPDLTFDDGAITSREQWYKACLSHPAIQDKITLEHLWVDEKQKEAGALCKTQAINRKSGEVLLELKMNVLYTLKIDDKKEIKIARVQVFLESNPQKASKLFQIYAMGSQGAPKQ
jgi:hypothetical protein